MSLKRMWINQPSAQQPHHELHGTNVLARENPEEDGQYVRVYFLAGKVASQLVDRRALSDGWRE